MGTYHNYAGVSIQYVQKCLIVLELEMIFVCHPIADGYFVNQYLPQPVVIFNNSPAALARPYFSLFRAYCQVLAVAFGAKGINRGRPMTESRKPQ